MKKTFLIITIVFVSVVVWAFAPSIDMDNPAIGSGKEWFTDIGFNLGYGFEQNMLNLNEVLSLMGLTDAAIVFDATKLEYVENIGWVVSPLQTDSSLLFAKFGVFGVKVGVNASLFSNLSLNFPYGFLRVLLNDPSLTYDEKIKDEFNFINGGVFAKIGVPVEFPVSLFGNSLQIYGEVGAYSPIIWADPDEKMTFIYNVDKDQARVEIGFTGDALVYSGVANDVAFGFYADLGAYWSSKIKNIPYYIGFSVKNFSIVPAHVTSAATATAGFKIKYENMELETNTENLLEIGEDFVETEGTDVKLPFIWSVQLGTGYSFLGTGLHVKSIEETGMDIGGYLSIFDTLWIDLTRVSRTLPDCKYDIVHWKKTLGLNFDVNFVRFGLELGVAGLEWYSILPDQLNDVYMSLAMNFRF